MQIARSVNEVAYENTYYIYNEEHVLIVDPGSDTATIFSALEQIGKIPAAILLTHTHYDHILSVDKLREKYTNLPVYVHPLEADWLGDPMKNLSGLSHNAHMENLVIQPADYFFEDEKSYSIGGMTFTVVETPGHSAGSVSLIFKDFVVSGDAMFQNSIGRWDLPTGNQETLLNSCKTRLLVLPEEFKVYPGHGEPTTIGMEKEFNPFF
ncbi:MAG: MBL fold metallo-hydrolase [Streptococcaceae bacterium]|nr:MBL fold metallo-hydrolase [Streptococcaceae bacterium]